MEKEQEHNPLSLSYKAHAIILPFPLQGHINPMLQFSKRLISKGVKITLANTKYINMTTQYSNHYYNQLINIETISDGYDDGHGPSDYNYLETFKKIGSQTLTDLVVKINRSSDNIPVNVIMYDAFLPWALDVARQLGVLGVVFFTQSCAVNSVYYHVQRGLLQVPVSDHVSLPGLPVLQASEAPSFVSDIETYRQFLDLVVTKQFSNIDEADWVLDNSFYELEKEVVEWMSKKLRILTIGPTIPSMYLEKRLENDRDYGIHIYNPNTTCVNWLQDKPRNSVVYVSFGSIASIGEHEIEEIAFGLKATNCYFLWVVRGQEQHKLPDNFMEETSNKGLVVTWCPQLEVLSHESCGCFVTHCGFNSVMEGLSLGVPMVAMPIWTDQPTNAKYVEDVWKVGVRAKKDEDGVVRRETIEKCIRDLMVDGVKRNEVVVNGAKWKKLAVDAVHNGGSSDRNIDLLVASFTSHG